LAGYKVLVIEAGADEAPSDWNITVPYLNAKASEDSRISWKFLVRLQKGGSTVPGHKPERNPYGTLPKRLSDFCPMTVQ